jgi:hypothetical protein
MSLIGRAIRTAYRATIVQFANRSRRRRGLPELDPYGRRCLIATTVLMGTFLAICLCVGVTAATIGPASPTAAPATRSSPRYIPPPIPSGVLLPMPTVTSAPPTTPDPGPAYVPLPDNDDDDFDKPRICHRKWWC